jgi:hypothetical protein
MSGIANSQNSAGKKKKNKRKVILPLDTCKSTGEISRVNRDSEYTNTTNNGLTSMITQFVVCLFLYILNTEVLKDL